MGDTHFGSGAGAWSKYLDEYGNVTTAQKERKEKFFTNRPPQPRITQNGKLYHNKQPLLIPSRFAIEMQERGWILRDDIIWPKPNRIPASVTDRMNNTYAHVFHFVLKEFAHKCANKYKFVISEDMRLGNYTLRPDSVRA